MEYPDLFERKIIGAFSDTGKKWLEDLNAIVPFLLEKWNLTLVGAVGNLSYNYVLKVKDAVGKPVILKIGIPNYDFNNEIRTLKAYDGKGCAQIIRADAENGAMLLEHLQPGKMLSEIEEEMAVKHFAKVWTTLRRPMEENEDHPSIEYWMKSLDRYLAGESSKEGLISDAFIRLAQTCFIDVTNSSKRSELLHGDLHHQNILFSATRGWLAIDPKGVIGDPYFDIISFLINQLFHKPNPKQLLEKRVTSLCNEMQLEKGRLLKAAVAMSTLSACWGIEDNDTDWETAYQCAQWFAEMLD
ncbi:aminoglycoside phosphotransferase family protein [Bacillus sp. FJAT-22090]|uniref:aminoglycoside phosphotransferase family protein n=1 Tax=Bacillus sp. FJAT-22090 TaxID=1581038 RepID=UPI0011A995B8|nr:aminoglycoside phosphotransferase family protein [Bacillus sp. FJAT-22090]